MNRKGFTLVEVLAVIIVIALVFTLVAPSISDVYENSKLKSEEIFVERLSSVIDSYVKLNSGDISFTSNGTATKKEGESTYTVDIYKGIITINNIINDKLLSKENYINAGNKEASCNINAEIEVYRDSDYVYCHKIKKESLDCLSDKYKKYINEEYVLNTCTWSK